VVDQGDVARIFREEYGRAVAVLVRLLGDIDLAEEAVQEAFAAALDRWPRQGMPPSPQGWIVTTARNKAIDRARREASRHDRHAQALLLHAPAGPEEVGPVRDEMKAAGAFVFTAGLHDPSSATVVRVSDDETLTTDGPFAEGKEHLGGFTIVQAADLDAALEWGRKLARATTLPVEVRPLRGEGGD